MFKKAMISAGIASVMLAGTAVTATPASAHQSRCERKVNPPVTLSNVDRISGYARIKCPLDSHHAYVSVDAWVEVWAPNVLKFGGGTWKKIGPVDEDDDYRMAIAVPNTAKLYGYNRYRTSAKFVVHGVVGDITYNQTSTSVGHRRYMPPK